MSRGSGNGGQGNWGLSPGDITIGLVFAAAILGTGVTAARQHLSDAETWAADRAHQASAWVHHERWHPPGAAKARTALGTDLPIQPEGNLGGYHRVLFAFDVDRDADGCRIRDRLLASSMTNVVEVKRPIKNGGKQCTVISGVLVSPYTGKTITYSIKSPSTVQIDHVVPLAEAWRSGAKGWTAEERKAFANDPRNLLAVDGTSNERKGDRDPAHWLPPLVSEQCDYARRYVGVKEEYHLPVDQAEAGALAAALGRCGS